MAVPVLKELTHLPVIVDPSHAAGRRDLVDLAVAGRGRRGRRRDHRRGPPRPRRGDLRRPADAARPPTSRASAPRRAASPRSQASRRGRRPGCITRGGSGPRHAARSGVRDRRIEQVVPLTTPQRICSRASRSRREHATWSMQGATDIAAILNGTDDRLLVVVGPVQRARRRRRARLRPAAERAPPASCADDLCIAMRVYFEKPRTTTGWKGLINDPHLDGSGDVNAGLRMARDAAARGARRSACRWAASSSTRSPRSTSPTPWRGARSARARPRARSTASSARACRCRSASRTAPTATCRWRSTPCAPRRCRTPSPASTRSGTPAILHTRGNPDCHVILRGGRDAPNYAPGAVAARPRQAARGAAARAARDRRLARQQRQGPRPPAGGGRRRGRPGGGRQPRRSSA